MVHSFDLLLLRTLLGWGPRGEQNRHQHDWQWSLPDILVIQIDRDRGGVRVMCKCLPLKETAIAVLSVVHSASLVTMEMGRATNSRCLVIRRNVRSVGH